MKKVTTLFDLKFSFLLCMVLVSCTKESNFFEKGNTISHKEKVLTADILFSSELDNESSIKQISSINKNVSRTLIPLMSNDHTEFGKYILIEQNGNGNQMVIRKVISKDKIKESDNLFMIQLQQVNDVIYFTRIEKKGIKSILLLEEKGIPLTKDIAQKEIQNSNYAPVSTCEAGGTTAFCIDHWWVTYDSETGEVLTIDYIDSDCYSYCLNGGGGGAGEAPIPESCTAVATKMADNGHVANEIRSITENYLTPTTREVTYQWICLINYGGWGLLSTEKGVHKKSTKLNNPWEWVSLSHVNVVKEGWTVGGTVKHSETPITTVGIYTAGIQLLINIKYEVACIPAIVIEKNHQASRYFFINSSSL